MSKIPYSPAGGSSRNEHPRRAAGYFVSAVLAGVTAIAAIINFALWSTVHHTISWAAEEASQPAVYPAHHALTGLAAGVAVVTAVAVTTILVSSLMSSGTGPDRHVSLWLVGAGLLFGLAVAMTILYSIYFGIPLLGVGILLYSRRHSVMNSTDRGATTGK